MQPQQTVSVAQLVEQLTLNQRAIGSSPIGDTSRDKHDIAVCPFFFVPSFGTKKPGYMTELLLLGCALKCLVWNNKF